MRMLKLLHGETDYDRQCSDTSRVRRCIGRVLLEAN